MAAVTLTGVSHHRKYLQTRTGHGGSGLACPAVGVDPRLVLNVPVTCAAVRHARHHYAFTHGRSPIPGCQVERGPPSQPVSGARADGAVGAGPVVLVEPARVAAPARDRQPPHGPQLPLWSPRRQQAHSPSGPSISHGHVSPAGHWQSVSARPSPSSPTGQMVRPAGRVPAGPAGCVPAGPAGRRLSLTCSCWACRTTAWCRARSCCRPSRCCRPGRARCSWRCCHLLPCRSSSLPLRGGLPRDAVTRESGVPRHTTGPGLPRRSSSARRSDRCTPRTHPGGPSRSPHATDARQGC